MKKLLILVSFLIAFLACCAQVDTTTLFKKQKGILFLTDYNYQYDYIEGQEMRPLGFHDFFFPVDSFDIKVMLDSNRSIDFRNGIRIDFIKDRKPLKEQARVFKGKDTSWCYGFDKFYILSVEIEYKKILEYWPLVCRRSYFDIKVENGSPVHFEYLHEAIKPTKIVVQSKSKKSFKARKKRKHR